VAEESKPANGNITYTTKELLARIEGKIDTIAQQLEHKADRSSLDALNTSFDLFKQTALFSSGPVARMVEEHRAKIEDLEGMKYKVMGVGTIMSLLIIGGFMLEVVRTAFHL
jgi:hypothetical protein